VEHDFDEDFARTLGDGLDRALEKLTPEQRAELPEVENLGELMTKVLNDASDHWSRTTVEQLKKDAPAMLEHRRREREQFEARVAAHWGRAFDLAEMVMKVAYEVGEFFYNKHVPPDGEHDFVFEALTRLQARALRVSEEVLLLLKAGYGQAGMSRWRAMHEMAVVAGFIWENGEDTAERYFAHEAVETWKAMKEVVRIVVELWRRSSRVDGQTVTGSAISWRSRLLWATRRV
jgi:Family of unknown function (DUF5677)